jgi:hypothetical protein
MENEPPDALLADDCATLMALHGNVDGTRGE